MVGDKTAVRPAGLRRRPSQRRSRERVQQILTAAAELLAEDGYPALSTSAIAHRAGVSVASIYQFFPNTDGIVVELADGWRAAFDAAMDQVKGGPLLDDLLGAIVDAYACFFRTTPGYSAVYFAGTAQVPGQCDVALERRLRELLTGRRTADGSPTDVVARVLARIIDALMALAFREDPAGSDPVLSEAKRVLHSYVADTLAPAAGH